MPGIRFLKGSGKIDRFSQILWGPDLPGIAVDLLRGVVHFAAQVLP